MSLTVAIPTMDRWHTFLKTQLPVYLNHPRVSCVIVSDENGNDIADICKEGYDLNPKLRLYQNDRVMGVYGNKRQCLLKAPTEWVAVLDSDNIFEPEYFDAFFKCLDIHSKKTIYCAGNNERLFLDTGKTENKTSQFAGMNISRDNWNKVLNTPGWNFLLNDGNAIWPSEVVRHFPDLPEEQIVGTDSLYFMRQAIQAGFTLRVEPTMRYIHTVHSGSHWLQNEKISTRLMAVRDWRV